MAGFFLLLVGFSSAFVVHQRNRILPHAFPKALLSTATGDLEDPDENEKRMETVSDLLADTTPIVPKRRWMGGVMKLSVPFVALAGADVALRHVAGEGFRSIVRKMIDARSKFDMRLLSPLLAFFAAMVSFIYRVLDRFPQFTLDNRKEVREEKKLRIELEKENREAQRFKWEQVRTELDMSQVMKLTRKEQQIREEVLQLAQRIAERQNELWFPFQAENDVALSVYISQLKDAQSRLADVTKKKLEAIQKREDDLKAQEDSK